MFGVITGVFGNATIFSTVTEIAKSTITRNLTESFVDNVFKDKVASPAVGSIVYCDLAAGHAEHSGIYVGNNRIVHLDGSGMIESVTPKQFMDRLSGFNTAISIYVSCKNGSPVGFEYAAIRAKSMIGKRRNYSLLSDNCHQFTVGCLSANFENSCNFLWMLKDEAKNKIYANEWRVWDV